MTTRSLVRLVEGSKSFSATGIDHDGRTDSDSVRGAGRALGGFSREVAAWQGYVDPKHEAGKLMQRITKGTLRAAEAWTDGHAEDDKYVELDNGLAALANVTEDAARSTVPWVRGHHISQR